MTTNLNSPASPEVSLTRPRREIVPRTWQYPLPTQGKWRVLGAPGLAGTGVTSFLIDTVVARIQSGASAEGVLVITASKEAGALLRRELAARIGDYAAGTTLVRSVHSLAFALLRQALVQAAARADGAAEGAELGGGSVLRLITGAEQDAVIRELLSGHVNDGGTSWPEYIRPAVPLVGFARQLRDFMLRAGERGLSAADIAELGAQYQQPLWAATGAFMKEYEQVMLLAGQRSHNAAELVAQVMAHPEVLSEHGWHTIVVDDAQLLDPNAADLISALAPGAELFVVGGDPEQAVFGFRGASEDFLMRLPERFSDLETVELREPQRRPQPACVTIVDSPGAQQDAIADLVRRRHLEDGIAWRDIAVIVRGGGEINAVCRGLLAAGVPVQVNPTAVVLSEQRLVAAMMQALRAIVPPAGTTAGGDGPDLLALDQTELEELLTGPVGGADPITMRRLIRGLRRWKPAARGMDTLRELLHGPLPDFGVVLTEREVDILIRVRAVLTAGWEALGGSIEEVLWAVWDATGLAGRLQAAALRGGATGSQADRDLDAVMALFDLAGDYSERYPEATLEAFIEHVETQELPTGVRDRRGVRPQAVEVLSAHGAVGREWDTVVLVGAQEGSWPSLVETGSIFGQEDLVDLLDDGIPPGSYVNHLAERLVQERRLFHVATSRHRDRLAIVAIQAPEGNVVYEPSRFITEFFGGTGQAVALPAVVDSSLPGFIDPVERAAISVLSVPNFVAELRRALLNPDSDEATRRQAARQLARMAQAGVPGAHPDEWWGVRAVASAGSVEVSGNVSPSRVEALINCPLSAVLGSLGGEDEDSATSIHLLRGNMAHAYLEALGRDADPVAARELTEQAYGAAVSVPEWQREHELEQFAYLLNRTQQWVAGSRKTFELVGAEVPVRTRLAEGVTIRGFIDRLERSGEDYFVVDLKTGKTPPSAVQTQQNYQLATYQLALRGGQIVPDAATGGVQVIDGEGLPVGGGILVYPASDTDKVAVRDQSAWPPEELDALAAQLPGLVAQMRGPALTARHNDSCDRCQVKSLCPVQPEGRTVVDV